MERLKQENARLTQELAAARQESLERLFASATLMIERDHAQLGSPASMCSHKRCRFTD